MERRYDFVKRLDRDVSLMILMCLDDPRDVTKLEGVSKEWLRFVVENGLQKKLCLKLCPEVSKIVGVELIDKGWYRMPELGICELLVREHRVFTFLSWGLTYWQPDYRIKDFICALGSDVRSEDGSLEDYSDEEDELGYWVDEGTSVPTAPGIIVHEMFDKVGALSKLRYWVDEGTSDPTAPVIIVHEMFDKLGVISEILLTPRKGYRAGPIIFSTKAVRFSMGHRRSPLIPERTHRYQTPPVYDDDMFIWTYTSPKFPMAEEYELQRFRLGRPVLCMGGILKIELLERVNKDDIGLYRTCLDNIKVFGRSLASGLEIDMIDSTGNCILRCNAPLAKALKFYPYSPMPDETYRTAHFEELRDNM